MNVKPPMGSNIIRATPRVSKVTIKAITAKMQNPMTSSATLGNRKSGLFYISIEEKEENGKTNK